MKSRVHQTLSLNRCQGLLCLVTASTVHSLFNISFSAAHFLFTEAVYTFYSAAGPLKQLSADYGYAYECLTEPINFRLNANNSNVNVTLTNIDFKPFDVRDGHLGNGKDIVINLNL